LFSFTLFFAETCTANTSLNVNISAGIYQSIFCSIYSICFCNFKRFPTILEISGPLACDSIVEFMNPIFFFIENVLWYKNTRFSWLSRDWHILLVIAAKCTAMCLIINGKQFVIQCLLLPLLAISPADLRRISAKIRRKCPDVNLRRQSTRCSLRVKMWLFARRGENRFQLFLIYSF